MATIINKTSAALTVPLPGGKKLRLGPLQSGDISPKAIDHPAVQKLVEAGDVEIVGAKQKSRPFGGGGPGSRSFSGGHGPSGSIRRTGDR